jgi:glucosamine--fructose-6-phosphate aminotransferase (isomerizing)
LLGSADVRRQVHEAAERLHRSRRLWVVGTGTSLHAAELGASLIQLSGETGARGPGDAVRRLRSAGRPAGRGRRHHPHGRDGVRALHARAGVHGRPGARDGHEARLRVPDAVETVDKETSDTYTVSYTTAVLALAMLAKETRRGTAGRRDARRVPAAVAAAIADPAVDAHPQPERLLVFVGAGRAPSRREGRAQVRGGIALPR